MVYNILSRTRDVWVNIESIQGKRHKKTAQDFNLQNVLNKSANNIIMGINEMLYNL